MADENKDNYHVVPFCPSPVRIVKPNKHFLFVAKPAGLLTIPGRREENKDCLITRLQNHHKSKTATVVHRLDMATSGIMVVALSKMAHREISRQFEHRETQKHYIAVVDGIVQEDEGVIDLPMIADWPNRPKQKIDFEQGKKAVTEWQVLERDEENQRTRLKLVPITGRSHQLRLHCYELGHPILGCNLYHKNGSENKASRLLLHAESLTIKHPTSGKPITARAPCSF
ncbi:pseudouridine synthase [Kangiella sediminilitoris]|uniref:Dual-specificity RNA pseudouridine synthase RluA n=1 Tax=Kangiella sediminilitoris TaxID=1144748 RepID=A0A1B3BAX9_9GAMM|nr:pseudouridine synthase [Kangiella sediminilitoris]AOE49952.1 pseudouridine synthase [Kangiella sediminilitoris]